MLIAVAARLILGAGMGVVVPRGENNLHQPVGRSVVVGWQLGWREGNRLGGLWRGEDPGKDGCERQECELEELGWVSWRDRVRDGWCVGGDERDA